MRTRLAILALLACAACDERLTEPPLEEATVPALRQTTSGLFTSSVYRFDYFGAVLLGNYVDGLLSLHTPYVDGVYHWWPELGICDGATEIRTGIQQRVLTEQGEVRLSKFDKFHVLVYRWNGEPITCEFLNNEYGTLVAEGIADAVSVTRFDPGCSAGDLWNWNVGGHLTDVHTGQTLGYGAHRTHVQMPDCTWRENLSRKGPWLAGKGWSGNSTR